MQCIDAIEGVLKRILEGFKDRYAKGEMTDPEYILAVRTLIDAAVSFLETNPEIGTQPDLLRGFLYDAAKTWWLERLALRQAQDALEDDMRHPPEDEGYGAYFFDYVFQKGAYPD